MSDKTYWDVSIAVVSLGVAAVVLGADGLQAWPGAAAAIGLGALHLCWGRRLLTRDRPVTWYVLSVLTVFALGTAATTTVSYLLFAVCPIVFLVLPLSRAIAAAVIANALPVLTALLRDRDPDILRTLGPLLLMTALFAVGIGFWITKIVEQNRERLALIEELDSRNAEIERLSRVAGAEGERARLAGEIHDTLAQGFTSIITLLQAVDPGLKDERLRLAVTTARENLAESRAMVAELMPSALSAGSLEEAVCRQVERAITDTMAVSFCTHGETRRLPTQIEVVLLRTVQEALTNAGRHAQAMVVTVWLDYTPGRINLTISDDGCGFDVRGPRGYGLDTMAARAEQIGGVLSIRSKPGNGTEIILEVAA